jgi:hypothetical protein
MEHFHENIEGWWGCPEDINLYNDAVALAEDDSHFVEVGSWLGKSSTQMAVNIINSCKKIRFDCVDTWEGSNDGAGHEGMDVIKEGKLFDRFLENIEPVKHVVNAVRIPSVDAAKLYKDKSLDFVFIDGDHSYESVSADLKAWFPKLKDEAIFAGHDFSNPLFGVKEAVEDFCVDIALPFEVLGHFNSRPEVTTRLSQHRYLKVPSSFDPAMWYIDLAQARWNKICYNPQAPVKTQREWVRESCVPMWRHKENNGWTNAQPDDEEEYERCEPGEVSLLTSKQGQLKGIAHQDKIYRW